VAFDDWLILIVAVASGLAIPVGVFAAVIGHRFARRRRHKYVAAPRTVITIPSLGEFSSYDNHWWSGPVRDVEVSVQSAGPPAEERIKHVIALLDRLPQLADRAREFAKTQRDTSGLPGGAETLEIYGLSVRSDDAFELELLHPADEDGFYRFAFRDDEPIRLVRED